MSDELINQTAAEQPVVVTPTTQVVTVRIIAAGSAMTATKEVIAVEAPATMTLREALEATGRRYDPDAVYRSGSLVLTPDSELADKANVLEAHSETNGAANG